MARNVVRTTISVASDLKARMDAIGEPVNWSAVASRAFEQEVARIIQKRGAKTMDDVVTRLRASKRKTGGKQYEKGREAGESWARDNAGADQLARLEEFREACEADRYTFEDYFETETNAPLDHAGWIAAAILAPEDDQDTREAEAFADELFGERRTDDFVRGFVDAAVDVWASVKDRL
jgi:hypothetical protein